MDWLKERAFCYVCKAPYRDIPKVLPGCLHVFCSSCLHKIPFTYTSQECEGKPGGDEDVKGSPSVRESGLGESCKSTRSADSALAESDGYSVSPSSGPLKAPLQRSNSLFENNSVLARNRQTSDTLILSVSCPKCDRPSTIPHRGISGLRTDYLAMGLVNTYESAVMLQSRSSTSSCDQCVEDTPAVSYCVDCSKLICEDHSKCHTMWEEFANHQVHPLSSMLFGDNNTKRRDSAIVKHLKPSFRLGEFRCPRHRGTSDDCVKFFCKSCCDLMCVNCTISTHRSTEHRSEFITPDYLSEKKKLVSDSLDKLSTIFQDLDVVSADIGAKTNTIAQTGDEAKNKINQIFSEITKLLEARKKVLYDEIDEVHKDSLSQLSQCTKEVNQLKDHIRECQDFIRGNLSCEGDLSSLTVSDVISSHTKSIASEYKDIIPKVKVPVQSMMVTSTRYEELKDAISKYGGVHALPSLPLAQDKQRLLPLDLRGKKEDAFSKTISQSMASLEIFSRNLQDSITKGYVYSPPRLSPPSGPQTHDDLSSPVMINLPKVAGVHVRAIENVSKPSGIRIDRWNSNIVVCSFGAHQIICLDQMGREIYRIGEEGDRNGQFLYPQNSVVDSQGRTLVVDSLYRIQVFDRSGKFVKSIGQKGKGRVQFNDPVAIAIGSNKKIYVLERHNQRIQVLNSNFTFHSFIGKAGRGECEFYMPNDMTIGGCGHIYVADTGNHRIQILSSNGNFLFVIGKKGTNPGELNHPSHICVGCDEICVSEEGNHRVSIFSMKGYFLQSFGQKGSGERDFYRPAGIAIDQNRTVYVCDSKNNRIQIFK